MDNNHRVTETVAAALRLDRVSHNFTVELSPAEAVTFTTNCTEHGITPKALTELVEFINAISPMRRPRLECNGCADAKTYPVHYFNVGKEYSRVLYVTYPKGSLLPLVDWNRLRERIYTAAREHGADEITIVEDTDHALKIRMWWE